MKKIISFLIILSLLIPAIPLSVGALEASDESYWPVAGNNVRISITKEGEVRVYTGKGAHEGVDIVADDDANRAIVAYRAGTVVFTAQTIVGIQ